MIQHDAKRWGPPRAALPDRPRLVRVLSLIFELAKVSERAMPDAAGLVLDRLAGAQLFGLNPSADACLIGDAFRLDRVWPAGHAPGFVLSFWDVK